MVITRRFVCIKGDQLRPVVFQAQIPEHGSIYEFPKDARRRCAFVVDQST